MLDGGKSGVEGKPPNPPMLRTCYLKFTSKDFFLQLPISIKISSVIVFHKFVHVAF